MLLPVQSVGVMGDARTYDNALAVRCVNTDDFMTADWSHLPYDLLARISTRIINEVKGVNRVVYDISRSRRRRSSGSRHEFGRNSSLVSTVRYTLTRGSILY